MGEQAGGPCGAAQVGKDKGDTCAEAREVLVSDETRRRKDVCSLARFFDLFAFVVISRGLSFRKHD